MKVKAYLILIVVVAITFISTQANTEESVSPKDKAIELAKNSVFITLKDGTEMTAQEHAEECTKGNHIFPIGWDAVDVSETMYFVVFKFIMKDLKGEDREAGWYYHVVPKDNIAQQLGFLETHKYLDRITKMSTYNKEKIRSKLYELVGKQFFENEKLDRSLDEIKGEEP